MNEFRRKYLDQNPYIHIGKRYFKIWKLYKLLQKLFPQRCDFCGREMQFVSIGECGMVDCVHRTSVEYKMEVNQERPKEVELCIHCYNLYKKLQ